MAKPPPSLTSIKLRAPKNASTSFPFFFFTDTATTEIYTLSLHDALPILDWAATARRGRLVTRLYQHERNHTVLIALDTSRLMGGRVGARTKLDYAVDGALALAYAALTAGDRVGLVVFDREVRGHLRPRAHRKALGLFVEVLRGTEAHAVEADYRTLAREVGAWQRRRALVVVLTDFVEIDAASLVAPLALLARRHRVLLIALRDRAYEALAPTAPLGADGPPDLSRL